MSEAQTANHETPNRGPALPAKALLLAVLAALLILFGRHAWLCLAHPYPIEYGEGVILHGAARIQAGQSLYPPVGPAPYLHHPYTPLGGQLLARLTPNLAATAEASGNPFFAGRLLIFAALLTAAFLIFATAAKSSRFTSIIAAALFLLSPIAWRYGLMLRVDALALAFALASVCLLERAISPERKHGAARLIISAGLLAAAVVLTKPLFLAAAIAGSIAAFRRKPGFGASFATATASLTALALAVAAYTSTGSIFTHLLALNRLPLNLAHGLSLLLELVARQPILLAGLAMYLWLARRERDVVWWYALLTIPFSLLIFKTGAEENYFLELTAAAALACGRLAVLLNERTPRAMPLLLWCALAQLLLYAPVRPAPVFTRTYGQELASGGRIYTPTPQDREIGQLLTAELRAAANPVLCEDLGYMLLANKRVILQPYQFTQLNRAGRWDDTPIVEMIQQRAFTLIVFSTDPAREPSPYYTPAMRQALNEHYISRRTIGKYHLLEPIN